MQIDYQLGELAASQAGFLGHDQVIAHGLSDDGIHWRLKSGVWIPTARGLYRVKGVTGDYRGLLRGAMAILPEPTVSHEAAAELHGFPNVRRGKAVVTVHASTTHKFPGVTIHRSIDLLSHHRSELGGMWATTPGRTMNDLASVLGREHMARVMDQSLADRVAELESVQSVFNEIARRGKPGMGTMRGLIGERVGSPVIKATALERVGLGVFERGGIPRPEFQYPAPWNPNRLIDFAWPWCCVGCEADGLRWHTRNADFQNDRLRDNLALVHGWRIFRFTWDDFQLRPHIVVRQLTEALAA